MEKSKRPLSSLLAFMADLHHEIRSPVNTILNMTELALRDEGLSPSMASYIQTIERSANALLTLLDDVIELSQDDFESASKEQGFGLTDLLEDLKEAVYGVCVARGAKVSLAIEEDTPEWFSGPRGRLRQVLTQILNFSIRQLGADSLDLTVTFDQVGNGDFRENRLQFQISAHGDKTTPLDTRSILRNPRILICQRLLMELDHELKVDQESGGTEFKFSVGVRPLNRAWALPIYPTPVSCVVGDQGIASILIGRRLQGCGFKVLKAKGLAEAQRLLSQQTKENQKGIIVADWSLVGTDQLGSRGSPPNFPIVYHDIPALKMMELSANVSSTGEKDLAIGLAMAPSKGKQVLLEVLSLLGMEPDQLSCPLTQEESEETVVETFPQELEGMRVLVVEDDKINQKIVVEILKKFGVRPVVASTGMVAMKAVKKHMFDAIFMDINLPDTDGYKLTEEIREIDGYKDVPIIALTASTKNRSLCLEAGMNYFLSKPYSESKLIKSLLCTKKE